MANIKEYKKTDGSKAYMFNIYVGKDPKTGKEKRTTRRGFKTIKEAKTALSLLEADIILNDPFEEEEKVVKRTFEEIYWNWYEEYKTTVKPSSLLKNERLFKNHILPAFGDKFIDEITPMMCQEQMYAWHKKLVRAREVMSYTGLVFDYAIRFELIINNPTKAIRRPVRKKEVKEDKDLNFYDKEELKLFLNTAEKMPNKRAYVFFRLISFTGIRKGEALALKWTDVDYKLKTLNINKGLSRKETGLYIETPKTPSSIRRISLDDKTLAILKEFMDENAAETDDLIFKNEYNEFLTQSKPRKWLIVIQNEMDKTLDKPMKRITIHGFRHTHASLLFESGASIKDVQSRLGHSDIQTTMDVYTHVSKSAREKLANQFNDFIDF